MVNEDDAKPVKKPIPLPRKSLLKQNKINPFKEGRSESEENISSPKKGERKSFVRDDWKSTSGSFVFEKSRQVKSEVQKLEKSVKNIIARRKSIQNKSPAASVASEHSRCDSLPDDSALLNISFNSPLSDEDKYSDSQSTTFSEDNSLYENELSPPSYPPPDLPDESVYDTMRNFTISDAHSCKSTSSDSTSNYDEISASQVGNSFLECSKSESIKEEFPERDFSLLNNSNNRYEIIDENMFKNLDYDCFESFTNIPETEILSPDAAKDSSKLKGDTNEFSDIKYIIHLFDPLQSDNLENSLIKSPRNFSNLSNRADSLNEKPALISIKKINSFKSEVSPSSSEFMHSNLNEGHYGKIRKNKSSNNDYVKLTTSSETGGSLEPPPILPRRNDFQTLVDQKESKNSKLCAKDLEKYENIPVEDRTKTSDILQWSSLKRVAKRVADNLESRASYISLPGKRLGKVEETPNISESKKNLGNVCEALQSFPKHSGILFKGGIQRWGVLSQRKLTLFANKDSPDVKETLPMNGVLSVNVNPNKISMETGGGINCFEISISSKKEPILFGVPSVSERHIWMRKLLESISPSFPSKLSMDYTKAGWCYAKESISCPWNKFCILLHRRILYLSSEHGCLITADLRKARSLTLQTEGFPCEKVTEKGPLMLIDLQDKTLYLQMDYERETRSWETAIAEEALKNGPTLCEQQLTKDDIPAVVDKCLNFVHTHGTFSEGIYRRNGSNRTVNHLLASFRCNAWSVQLNKDDCSEFDVSSVLKRYFRDLPEPLLVTEIHEELGNILETDEENKKIEKYKLALKKLPEINYLTARRLMGHLYFINKQKDKNLMGADNLAAIWGPTLLQVQEQVSLNSNCFKMEALVINDLITFYPEIFDVEESEVEKEMKILEMLEIYHKNSNTLNKKPSGELKIWVYLHSPKNVDDCINVSVNPQKTAEEVCKELSPKITEPIHLLCLEEIVCNGHLTRPLNHSEKVLDTVLRWSYWDEADRKDNCLVLTKNDLFREVAYAAKYPVIICEELKFADQKSKSFKSYQFEFSQAKLLCYKDKSCSQKIGEWKVEDIVWYLGHEPKRNPHARWSITFIEKQLIGPRTKERPYFGNTICGNSEEQKFKLISAMLMAQYAKDILPTPNLMMEYGLWNFHGGFWPGGNNTFTPTEGISRNFYNAVNNEVEPPTFHVSTPANGDVGNVFTTVSETQPCQANLRTNLEFLSLKNTVPINSRVPPMVLPGPQDDHLQNVGLEVVPMASDLVTEQSSMDSLAPTDSSMPPLLSHQPNPNNNSNNNNNITNNNNNNSKSNNNNDEENEPPPPMGKKDKSKMGRRDNEEVWEDVNGHGTNIKLENNSAVDYLFQQSYQHPVYGMMFTRMSNNKREPGTSDETDEEDDEGEEGISQPKVIYSMQNNSPSLQERSSGMSSVPSTTSVNFCKNGYECGECGLVAETRPGLKKHIAVFHPAPNTDLRLSNALLRKMSASAKCPMTSCRFRSSERNEMEVHMARHVSGGYKLNGKRRAGPLTPQRVRYEREEYRCQICAYSCTVEKAFYKHLKVHSVGREISQVKISCVICGKDRSSEVDMNKHMKKHRDDRYFCCDICIFKTVQLKKLIQHRRMHTGEKPHLCPHCSYRSARRDNLRSHVRRVHKKDNLFCDTFSPRGLLITPNTSNTSTVPSTPVPASNQNQQQPPPPPLTQ